jgi:hypothetical protein
MPVDIDKFIKRLNDNADTSGWGKGQCGQYVRMALQAGGAKIPQPYPATGKEYGPTLLMLGFHEITVENPDKFHFMKGDVMVMESYKANGAGHVAAYNGKMDFRLRSDRLLGWAGLPEKEAYLCCLSLLKAVLSRQCC